MSLGSPIEFVNLRLGIMVPEVGDEGRARGGKPYYQAAASATHSQRKAADAA